MTSLDDLDELIRKAETGEHWAEICRLESEILARDPCSHCGAFDAEDASFRCPCGASSICDGENVR